MKLKLQWKGVVGGIALPLAVLTLQGCQTPTTLTEQQGTLAGAGTGALAGAAVSDGLIVPAVSAIGGAVVGEEVAEDDPIFD